ncbi:hypothetical protein ACVWZK_008451 [Bradyrhizobium sp. GM0.4]
MAGIVDLGEVADLGRYGNDEGDAAHGLHGLYEWRPGPSPCVRTMSHQFLDPVGQQFTRASVSVTA